MAEEPAPGEGGGGLIMDKAGREAWIEEMDERYSLFGGLIGWDNTDYYEDGKPIELEKWRKLIEDLNNVLENAPGQCTPLEPLELPESDHVLTKEEVENIREKMKEMCENIEFDWGWYLPDWGPDHEEGGEVPDDKNLLIQPIGKALIYEIQDQMSWCNCGDNAYSVAESHYVLGTCWSEAPAQSPPGEDIRGVIEGMQLGAPGMAGSWSLYGWNHWWLYEEEEEYLRERWQDDHPGEPIPFLVGRSRSTFRVMEGDLNCEGEVDYGDGPDRTFAGDGHINYECYEDRECVLATEPPIWWFGPGWAEHAAQEYADCVEELEQMKEDAIAAAEAEVDRLEGEGQWLEYMLIGYNPGWANEECLEEEEEGGAP